MLASKMVFCLSFRRVEQLCIIKKQKTMLRRHLLEKIKKSLQLNYINNKDLHNLIELQQVRQLTLEIEEISKQLKTNI